VAFQENRVDSLPNLGERAQATARRFLAFVIEQNGKFLVRQRPAGVVNGHLWEFPNMEVHGNKVAVGEAFELEFGFTAKEILPLLTVKHSITRYRITMEAFGVRLNGAGKRLGTRVTRPSGVEGGEWMTPAEIQALAFTAAHKRLASAAIKSIMINP